MHRLDMFRYLCNMEQMLREMIEKMVGRKMVVPRDFTWLSQKVEERTQQRVSASTLRRFWGYVSEGVSASKFTKDVLAKFLGYTDFEQFGLSQGMGEQQSQMVIGWEISCGDLYEGQQLKLSWLPDRTCIVSYQGNGRFRVLASENTRLSKDDTFECHHFINLNLLIFMPGNMGICHRSLMPSARRTASSWSVIWKIENSTRWVSHISLRYRRTVHR